MTRRRHGRAFVGNFGFDLMGGGTPAPASLVRIDPDGTAFIAAEAANALGAAVCRVAPGGNVVDEVTMPDGLGVFACGLGGEDGRTLVACAAPDFYEHARQAAREAVLLTTTVEVPRAGLP
jgi:sugar lactone lactonase YvrE